MTATKQINLDTIAEAAIKAGFSRFDDMDWQGFGGAYKLPNGTEPLINQQVEMMHGKVVGHVTAIIDGNMDSTTLSLVFALATVWLPNRSAINRWNGIT